MKVCDYWWKGPGQKNDPLEEHCCSLFEGHEGDHRCAWGHETDLNETERQSLRAILLAQQQEQA